MYLHLKESSHVAFSPFALQVVVRAVGVDVLVVPRYGAYLMALTGLMMLFSDAAFWNLIPQRPLMIHIEVRGFPYRVKKLRVEIMTALRMRPH